MAKLWILRGEHEAPGWNDLRKDYENEKVDIIHLDAKVSRVPRSQLHNCQIAREMKTCQAPHCRL